MDRRLFLGGLGAAAAALALPACSRTDAGATAPVTTPAAAAPTSWEVRHRYGTTAVTGPPQRVVTLGQTDHDAAIALGFVPVAVGGFLGGSYTPFRPWNEAGRTGPPPPVLDMQEIAFEKVAALAPDLILAVMSGVTKEDYAKLSQIAPTVAQPVDAEDWAVPYRQHTEHIGEALGKPDLARTLVDELDAAFAGARAANPQLAGRTAVCAEVFGGQYAVLGTSAPRTQFLADVGMTPHAALTALAGKGYNAPLSPEKIDLLDQVDVVVWSTDVAEEKKVFADPLVKTLQTTQQGRYVLAPNGGNDDLLYSMDWGSVLSNRWAIDQALPRIVRAADGDPATDANA
ncbi:ABC transporter substrate-binding protein [Microlunatus antarcticus]|uniref:Iron complex transport system substrate-binding protein n=1 Tax=Microlunatus antarcticus TaxID=53388 RepID=A0A7W5JS64_9ACTN|nr:ABC transporter substrate-binding protein [Microlunatus antarcticus]MBB3325379.1 iron complex transport system substrate-binding protein [Microlunatus antarcticus]